jgi:hypothetical protein
MQYKVVYDCFTHILYYILTYIQNNGVPHFKKKWIQYFIVTYIYSDSPI